MSDASSIEWTDATWNPVRGCTKVSAGCKHCYAERFAERWRGVKGHPFESGFDLYLVPKALELPLRWRKPRRVFVNSMSDLFHEAVPDEFIAAVFGVMAAAPQHTFQILTKRAQRLRQWFAWLDQVAEHSNPVNWRRAHIIRHAAERLGVRFRRASVYDVEARGWPLPNVWLGVSVEDQAAADERIPDLVETPASVSFLSCEPLLGPVDLTGWRSQIDWVIAGGESGPGARTCDVAWIRSLVRQCAAAAGLPVFVKQLGAHVEDRNDAGFDGDTPTSWPMGTDVEHDQVDSDYQGAPVRVRLRDRKGGDPAEWPADLRVREMPAARPSRKEGER